MIGQIFKRNISRLIFYAFFVFLLSTFISNSNIYAASDTCSCGNKMFSQAGTREDPYLIETEEQLYHACIEQANCIEYKYLVIANDIYVDANKFIRRPSADYRELDGNNKTIHFYSKISKADFENNKYFYLPLSTTSNNIYCDIPYYYTLQGYGTASNPYLITNDQDLKVLFSYNPCNNIYLKQTTDIEIKTSGKISFYGNYDGDGYTLKIGTYDMGIDNYGTFQNVKLLSTRENGGILFYKNYGTMEKVSRMNSGTSMIPKYSGWPARLGGIVTYNYGTIQNCVNYSSIFATMSSGSGAASVAGGIVAYNYGLIQNCGNHGKVYGYGDSTTSHSWYSFVGGIVGINHETGIIEDCYNANSAVAGGADTGNVSVDSRDGGIAGTNGENNSIPGGIIQNCYNVFEKMNYQITFSNYGTIQNVYGIKTGKDNIGWSSNQATQKGNYQYTDERLQELQFVEQLNNKTTQSKKPWISGDSEYPYPTFIFGSLSLIISSDHEKIGDNTNALLTIETPRKNDRITIFREDTKETLASTTGSFIYLSLSDQEGDIPIRAKITINGELAGRSNVISINKNNLLNRLLNNINAQNSLKKNFVIDDTDRYFENNASNRALVNKIKEAKAGIFFIDNQVNTVFQPLMESN